MIIEKLEIKNYGKLKDKTIYLSPGINIIYGENESGKSTIHSFITAMLFGVKRMRGRAAKTDDYKRYEPWENPSYYAGSMEFSCGSRRFYLERNFYKETQRQRLVCIDDGEELSVEDGDLQMLLGFVSQKIFENTVSVGQLKSVTGQELAEELKRYLANYQSSAMEDLDPVTAIARLKEQKKELLRQEKEENQQRDIQKQQLQAKRELLKQQQGQCSQRREGLEQEVLELKSLLTEERDDDSPKRQKTETKAEKEEDGNDGTKRKRLGFQWKAAALLWLLMTAALWLFLGRKLSSGLAFLLFLFCMVSAFLPVKLWLRWLAAKNEADKTKEDFSSRTKPPASAQDEESEEEDWEDMGFYEEYQFQLQNVRGKLQQIREEEQERALLLENLSSELLELEEEEDGRISLQEELAALQLAIDTLGQTMERMQGRIGSRLQKRMGAILCELTDGKYRQILMDDSMNLKIQTLSRSIDIASLSRGTLEQVYFSLRMAVSEILCEQEELPVILDDVFAMYDEKRLLRTLQWLADNRKQTILFTCHRREKELLEGWAGQDSCRVIHLG